MTGYDTKFYDDIWQGGHDAAVRVLPDLFHHWKPSSIVDVGCGPGSWLSVAADEGVENLAGVDATGSLSGTRRFDGFEFIAHDLTEPFALNRQFDMAMSIEVAEHLPASRAASFVHDLCSLASIVLFSAAYPGQGGVGHCNEQWPSHWVELFAAEGFEPFEVTRTRYWDDPTVAIALQVNLMLYARHPLPEALQPWLTPPLMLDAVPAQLWDGVLEMHHRPAMRIAARIDRWASKRGSSRPTRAQR
jgi:SAM-dependent methyltransferase